MTKKEALQISARAWCHPTTQNIPMSPELCEAFADILLMETGTAPTPKFGRTTSPGARIKFHGRKPKREP